MVDIRPFNAFRPSNDMVDNFSAPPYDVVDRNEVREILNKNQESFLQVTRADGLFPDSVNQYDDIIYNKSKENLNILVDNGVIIPDGKDSYYVYSQTIDNRTQTGLICATSVDDYKNDLIKKHEKTREAKEQDRIKHIDTLNANPEPVFLTTHSYPEFKDILNNVVTNEPVTDFTSDDAVRHRLWIISEDLTDKITDFFKSSVKALYIADGHHRAASSAKVGLMRREQNPEHTGKENYNHFLSVVFPSDDLYIMAYNRVVKDLNGMSKDDFFTKISGKFFVTEIDSGKDPSPQKKGSFSMYVDNSWYTLKPNFTVDYNDPVESLDVSILQNNILAPLLDIEDPRTSPRIDFVGGIHGTKALEEKVDSTKFTLAFSMYPTSIDELLNVADASLLMPPKSTWFEPKLKSGLFIRFLDNK